MNGKDMFQGIIGHEAAKEVLARAVEQPRNGYLLIGPDGVGCRSMAERFVRVLADHPEDRSLSAHPDIIVLEREPTESGAHLKKEISVKAVRELRTRISRRPSVAPRVVAYLPEADHLNEEGVNALLKSVEEPPAGAVFVLVAHQESRIPGTLLSRLVPLRLGRVPDECIAAWLSERAVRPEDREHAVRYAEGRPGAALRFINDPETRSLAENAGKIADDLIGAKTAGEAMATIAERASACDAAEDPVTEWRKTLQLWEAAIRRHAHVDPVRVHGVAHVLLMAERHLGGPISPRIWIEIGLVRVVGGRAPVFPGFLPGTFPYPMDG
jgi:hypothetical protein